MKNRFLNLLILLGITVWSCLPPPPPSCTSPSGNMICFDGVTYPMTAHTINGIPVTDCIGMHEMNILIQHVEVSPTYTTLAFSIQKIDVVGTTSPQTGTYIYEGGTWPCTSPAGTKTYWGVGLTANFNSDLKMFQIDTTLANTLEITNINVDLVSGHFEGFVKNISVPTDVRELKVYFEDLPL